MQKLSAVLPAQQAAALAREGIKTLMAAPSHERSLLALELLDTVLQHNWKSLAPRELMDMVCTFGKYVDQHPLPGTLTQESVQQRGAGCKPIGPAA